MPRVRRSRRSLGAIVAAVLLAAGCMALPAYAAPRGPLVLAAASLQEALTDAADAWAGQHHPRPVLAFAATSALARQIAAGAPGDLFIAADSAWIDDLARRGLLRGDSSAAFLGNRLALIAPAGSAVRLDIGRGFPLARALGAGRLAMADPDGVPAGTYARAALQKLGVWPTVAARVARAENVRAALALVERGAAPLGIVYATDARASARVRVIGLFPPDSHPPIVYALALLGRSRHPDAAAFRRFLLSPAGRASFARRGFTRP